MMESKDNKKKKDATGGGEISRREAIGKMGYAAFASTTMFLLLNNPTKVYANSNEIPDPGDDDPFAKSGQANPSTDPDPWGADSDPWK